MWLTKNEKKVLNLLIDNAKLSDTSIANDLKISSQAVGKIRKRLEEDVIKGYTLNLDSKMLGMGIIARTKLKLGDLTQKEIEEIEKKMINNEHIMQILKLPGGEGLYILTSGHRDLEELEKTTSNLKKNIAKECHIQEIVPLTLNSLLKNSCKDMHKSFIDSCGIKNQELEINKND